MGDGESQSEEVDRYEEDVSVISADHPFVRQNDIRKETSDNENDSVDIEPLFKVLDGGEVAQELSELVDLLASDILGVLDGRVFSRVTKVGANVVDSLPDTSSSRGLGLSRSSLGLDVGCRLDVQGRDISNGTGLVVEGSRVEVGAGSGIHCG